MAASPPTFHPRDAIANTGVTTLQMTAAGAIFAGIQNTLRKQNVGAMGIVTRSGGIIAAFAGSGFAYQFAVDASANLRQKDDAYNEAIAGFFGGAALGVARRSIPFMIGAGGAFSIAVSAWSYTKGIHGYTHMNAEGEEDEVERKEALKKMRRRPLSETIEQLGEGRGIYAPGYEERRRQRLLAKYGIDVKEEVEKYKRMDAELLSKM